MFLFRVESFNRTIFKKLFRKIHLLKSFLVYKNQSHISNKTLRSPHKWVVSLHIKIDILTVTTVFKNLKFKAKNEFWRKVIWSQLTISLSFSEKLFKRICLFKKLSFHQNQSLSRFFEGENINIESVLIG